MDHQRQRPLRLRNHRSELDVLGNHRQEAVYIARVEGPVPGFRESAQLGVLLRHRPPSIPEAQGSRTRTSGPQRGAVWEWAVPVFRSARGFSRLLRRVASVTAYRSRRGDGTLSAVVLSVAGQPARVGLQPVPGNPRSRPSFLFVP